MRDRPVGYPEDAAMPWASEAAVVEGALGQRPGPVAAPVGEYPHLVTVTDDHQPDVSDGLSHQTGTGKFCYRHQIMPARFHRVGSWLCPAGQLDADTAAQQTANPGRREPGQP